MNSDNNNSWMTTAFYGTRPVFDDNEDNDEIDSLQYASWMIVDGKPLLRAVETKPQGKTSG